MHDSGRDPGPRVVVRLTFGDTAGQSLGLGNNGWDDCVSVLGDGAESLSLGGCDLFGSFLERRQLLYVFDIQGNLLLWSLTLCTSKSQSLC
jgi:hypothetical protein